MELTRINQNTYNRITKQLSQSWLSRYPWPERCVHDNGGEFTGWEFQDLLQQTNITDVPTLSYNPTEKSMRTHAPNHG